jgi:hypothetical protein
MRRLAILALAGIPDLTPKMTILLAVPSGP